MGDVFGKPAIDDGYTLHPSDQPDGAGRVRLKDPKKVEMALWKLITAGGGQ